MEKLVVEKVGIVNIKELVGFGIDLVLTLVSDLEDGKFGLADTLRLIPLLKSGSLAFKDMSKIKDEILDLSDDEKVDLEKFVSSKLNISNQTVKDYILKGLEGLLELEGFFIKK